MCIRDLGTLNLVCMYVWWYGLRPKTIFRYFCEEEADLFSLGLEKIMLLIIAYFKSDTAKSTCFFYQGSVKIPETLCEKEADLFSLRLETIIACYPPF